MNKTKKSKEWLDLSTDYVVAKFFEYGLYPQHNKYNETYQCCCPICREGKSLGRKKRCYYVPSDDLIYCHNCGWSSRPYNWIRKVSGLSHDEISNEIKEGEYDYVDLEDGLEEFEFETKNESLPEDCVNLFDVNQLEYWKKEKIFNEVIEYLRERRIFSSVNRPDALYFSFKDRIHKNRIIIPFKDINGKIIFYQSRKIFDWDDSPKYKSKLKADRSLFGIDKLDSDPDQIFILEGPIDSFFVKNSIAVGGISEKGEFMFTDKQKLQWQGLLFNKRVWVLDSQWIDHTSHEKTTALIKKGEQVFIWPEKFGKRYKDINELCADKEINQISPKFILNNTYEGVKAEIKMKLISPSASN